MTSSRRIARRMLAGAATAALLLTANPLIEGPFAKPRKYSIATDPLKAGPGVKALAAKMQGKGGKDALKKLHTALSRLKKTPASRKGKVIRPPFTAEEAMKKGGDCTEFALAGAAALKLRGIAFKGKIVHFKGKPKSVTHLLLIATVGKKDYVIDPQARFNKMLGKPDRQRDVPAGKMSFIYHTEWGQYFLEKGKKIQAKTALIKSVSIFGKHAHSKYLLGGIYFKEGDMANATRHLSGAAALQPKNKHYGKAATVALYNLLAKQSYEALARGDCKAAVPMLKQMIRINPKDKGLRNNLKLCTGK